jgi:hypothetical protein
MEQVRQIRYAMRTFPKLLKSECKDELEKFSAWYATSVVENKSIECWRGPIVSANIAHATFMG